MDSQEEQQWHSNNEASVRIPVLASDSEKNVKFVVERPPSPSIECPCIINRAAMKALPTFSSSPSNTSSSLGEYL